MTSQECVAPSQAGLCVVPAGCLVLVLLTSAYLGVFINMKLNVLC